MIEATQLRIGNWVEAVASMGNYNMKLSSIHFEAIAENPNCVNPIPLTPEMLERQHLKISSLPNGVKYIAGMGLGRPKPLLPHPLLLVLAGNHLCLSLHQDNFPTLIDLQTRCFYVHQLQNLYFALMGEELEISLSIMSKSVI